MGVPHDAAPARGLQWSWLTLLTCKTCTHRAVVFILLQGGWSLRFSWGLGSCFGRDRQMGLQQVSFCFPFSGKLCLSGKLCHPGDLVVKVGLRLTLRQRSCTRCQDIYLQVTNYYLLESLATVALGHVGARLEFMEKLPFTGRALERWGSLMMLRHHMVNDLDFPYSTCMHRAVVFPCRPSQRTCFSKYIPSNM